MAQVREQVERDLNAEFPEADWTMLSDVLIFHGRRCCNAKAPACADCPVADSCPSAGK